MPAGRFYGRPIRGQRDGRDKSWRLQPEMLLSRPKTSVSDFNGADTAPALGVVPGRAVGDPEFLRDPLDRHTSRVKLGDPAPRPLRDRRSAGALALRLVRAIPAFTRSPM